MNSAEAQNAVQIAADALMDAGSVHAAEDLEKVLSRVLAKHGYPEEMDFAKEVGKTGLVLDQSTKEPTIDEIESMAGKTEKTERVK